MKVSPIVPLEVTEIFPEIGSTLTYSGRGLMSNEYPVYEIVGSSVAQTFLAMYYVIWN
jgi:hypothetical protein